MRNPTQKTRTGHILRRFAEELDQEEESERQDTEYRTRCEREEREREERDGALQGNITSIAISLRQIADRLQQLLHELSTRGTKA
jgi:hypothetical protein